MREIKFRAWNNPAGMMEYCGLERAGIHEAIGSIIMQYTGLKDKNGKEIYEGDIVEESLGENVVKELYVVKFGEFVTEGDGGYGGEFISGWYKEAISNNSIETLCPCEDLRIVGNIHENPELMEKKS